ncbi:MAG: tRNA (guanosine(37)-N1)-methyltransferase TrmD [Alphaproteobacteria bacterium]|nr:tRNA (guanosine(37)-N1)-methyltransferase TrmD [Alphaproteobacteria bacterium]
MPLWKAGILTLFPEMFPGPLSQSLAGTALTKGIWGYEAWNIRDFAADKHRTVDDTAFGGGRGMVMRPDVLGAAIGHAKAAMPGAPVLYFTPRGKPMNQEMVREMVALPGVILLCGRFEGIDERVIEAFDIQEVSLADAVLSGGEIPALALMDACIRLLPGVLAEPETLEEESFGAAPEYALLLEYPQYTRPSEWNGLAVPDVLLSGHHERIRAWRLEQAKSLTRERRPDLWQAYQKRKKE